MVLDEKDLDQVLGSEVGARLSRELRAALRRRPAQEASLAAALRVLMGHFESLREAAAAALDVLVRRNTLERPLYAALLRGLVEAGDARVKEPLVRALGLDDGGGLVTLAGAALSNDSALAKPLLHLSTSRSPHIAFAAELARAARGESDGRLVFAIAPRIKESHRIELCNLLLLPLLRQQRAVPVAIQALGILRDSERHLGRWLCIAELTRLSGSDAALAESKRLATEGPSSAQAAWSLVAWALDPRTPCASKPTLENVARLSDRPSAERDMSFLFRMAESGLPTARSMLEGLAKSTTLTTEPAVRAATLLVSRYGCEDFVLRLLDTAKSAKREPLRGLALAGIADCQRASLSEVSANLSKSRHHATLGFATLVRLASLRGDDSPIITELTYRRLQLGWSD